MSSPARIALSALFLLLLPAPRAEAQGSALIRFEYEPTALAQVALWIETSSGEFVQTVALTEATALRGIGNRPGALQMNSAFRWPFGRRESVLPIWAHHRAATPGAQQFRRVIFQQRIEGYASRQITDSTRDDYYCLSFQPGWQSANDPRDTLDAITCPSVFNSDKGRFITQADVDTSYSEPWENLDGSDTTRALGFYSLYPPRRDVMQASAIDSDDVDLFASHAVEVMPDIDSVTMATPVGGAHQTVQFTVPFDWPAGDYVAMIEVNVEGDYNQDFGPAQYPTPIDPRDVDPEWDYWAENYGYPYRGQPSVVYELPFTLGSEIVDTHTAVPSGYGSVHGDLPDISPMDGKITNDPSGAPGSGVDRLGIYAADTRFALRVIPSDICGAPIPPPECGTSCNDQNPCAEDFVCNPANQCEGVCDDFTATPAEVSNFSVEAHPDVKEAHHFAILTFDVPDSFRDIQNYEVRYSRQPILTEEDFVAATQAKRATLNAEALEIPTDQPVGTTVEVEIGGLTHQTQYYVALRATDICNFSAPFVTAEVETTAIHFTTVSPCFVATAAYGTPMAEEIGTLRRFRDRHLMNSALGRLAVDAYYAVGPHAAALIADSDTARSITRDLLAPIIDFIDDFE